MTPIISRGFHGRRDDAPAGRVPPGQYVTSDFPVLSAGPTPHTPLEQWDFSIVGEVDEPRRWTWEEFRALPSEEVTVDIHCVTKWSKLDTAWQGVSVDTLLDGRRDRRRVRRRSSATAATRRTCRWRTSPAARRGSRSATTASRSRRSTAARLACSSRICTSGRARSGCAGCGSRRRTSPASGSQRLPQLRRSMARTAVLGRLSWQRRGRRRRRRRDAARQDDRASTCPTGPGTGRASTSTSGSPPRTATRRSAATRSRRLPTAPASRSPSSASTTARSRRT